MTDLSRTKMSPIVKHSKWVRSSRFPFGGEPKSTETSLSNVKIPVKLVAAAGTGTFHALHDHSGNLIGKGQQIGSEPAQKRSNYRAIQPQYRPFTTRASVWGISRPAAVVAAKQTSIGTRLASVDRFLTDICEMTAPSLGYRATVTVSPLWPPEIPFCNCFF